MTEGGGASSLAAAAHADVDIGEAGAAWGEEDVLELDEGENTFSLPAVVSCVS